MSDKAKAIMNIGLVAGGPLCKEILEQTTFDYKDHDINARISMVIDPQPHSVGMMTARALGLKTGTDYCELYDPGHAIDLIIHLDDDPDVFEDILHSKPGHIRLLSFQAFWLFWKAIRLQQEKLLARTKEIETILNGIQDFILVINPEREIMDVNQPFLDQMGYRREEVIGRKCYEIFRKANQPCTDSEVFCPLNKVIRNRRSFQQVRSRVDHNGERRYIEVTIFPIWENEGKISRFIEISHDITERKKEQEEITQRLERMVEERTHQLKETHAKLLHQDKMASLGKLAASVVHEINNPISGILNLIMLIKRIIDEGSVNRQELERFSRYLDLMETETRRTSRIVSNLLSFSRQSKMDLKPVDLNRLLERTLFLNTNHLKIAGVKVQKRLDPALPMITGSEDQLQQVFMNLISNATEAISMNRGGVLTVETAHSPQEGMVSVTFKDTGAGISRENISRLFEPFFTTKKKGKGVGLGLSVAYGIIKEHAGAIQVQSEEGNGTTFRVELPVEPILETVDAKGASNG